MYNLLTKKRTLLEKHKDQEFTDLVYFQYGGDDEDYCVGYYMPLVDWINMGSPEQITVVVTPGRGEMTSDLRDEGEYNTPSTPNKE